MCNLEGIFPFIHDEAIRYIRHLGKVSEGQINAKVIRHFIVLEFSYPALINYQITCVLLYVQTQCSIGHFQGFISQRNTRQHGQGHQHGNGFKQFMLHIHTSLFL